jgi:hypothetical protein
VPDKSKNGQSTFSGKRVNRPSGLEDIEKARAFDEMRIQSAPFGGAK